VFTGLVDYSPARNSCIAAVDDYGKVSQGYQVVDLISDQLIHSKSCRIDDCGNGKNIRLAKERDSAFYQALTHADRSR
jgi:hypothetical protein